MTIAIILSLAGLFLIFLEFFLPGIVMGTAGSVLLVGSIVFLFLEDLSPLYIALYLVILFALLIGVIRFALYQVKRTGKKGTIYLQSDQEGFQASHYKKELIGKKGVAASDLKPSGFITINERNYQAVSKAGYIEQGAPIEIIGGQGACYIVKKNKD